MRKLSLALLLPGLLWCLSCRETASNDQQNKPATTSIPKEGSARDSVRQRYIELMENRANAFPIQQVIESGKVNPVDQAPLDTAFFLFREDLRKAIAEKDLFFLLDHIDKNIKNGFGGENGAENFVTAWNLDDPTKIENSRVWGILKRIIDYGGVFGTSNNEFYAPYFCFAIPEEVDPYESGVVLGQGVRLRSGPSLDFRIAGVVSYEILNVLDDNAPEQTIGGETHPWYKIATSDGTEGFVFGKFIGRPIDYRAGFQRSAEGIWRMTFLVAGD